MKKTIQFTLNGTRVSREVRGCGLGNVKDMTASWLDPTTIRFLLHGLENTLKAACPLIGTAVAIGDRRPYVTALLVLDPDAAGAFARAHGIEHGSLAELADDERVLAAVADGVQRAGERLSRVEQVKRFTLLGE